MELVHGCAHRFVAGYAFEGTELVYSDPPYLKGARTSRRRYRYDYEEADHVEWLRSCSRRCPARYIGLTADSLWRCTTSQAWRVWRYRVQWQVMNQGGVRTRVRVGLNFVPVFRVHWAHAMRRRTSCDRQRLLISASYEARMPEIGGRRGSTGPYALRRAARTRALGGAGGDDGGRGRVMATDEPPLAHTGSSTRLQGANFEALCAEGTIEPDRPAPCKRVPCNGAVRGADGVVSDARRPPPRAAPTQASRPRAPYSMLRDGASFRVRGQGQGARLLHERRSALRQTPASREHVVGAHRRAAAHAVAKTSPTPTASATNWRDPHRLSSSRRWSTHADSRTVKHLIPARHSRDPGIGFPDSYARTAPVRHSASRPTSCTCSSPRCSRLKRVAYSCGTSSSHTPSSAGHPPPLRDAAPVTPWPIGSAAPSIRLLAMPFSVHVDR